MPPTFWMLLRPRFLRIRQLPVPTRKFKSYLLMLILICIVWLLTFKSLHNGRINQWQNQTKKDTSSLMQLHVGPNNDKNDIDMESMLAIIAMVGATSLPARSRHATNDEDLNKVLFLQRAPKYVPRTVLVHLDFKGAPPKLTYLQELLPLLSRMGATGILIEYEDMFPYWGQLTHLSAHNAYSYEDVRFILRLAKDSHLDIIPLVQTFGHMEFALKSSEFIELREVPSFPQAICPSKPNSTLLIREMIDQTMAMHPGIQYLHIGCDEVFHLGSCRDCSRRMVNVSRRMGVDPLSSRKSFLFLEHVRDVAHYVKTTYPGVQPIVWDDMFRSIPTEYIVQSRLHNGLVEPMIWAYSTEIQSYITSGILNKYVGVFPKMWAAGAFKGAFGETNFLPDVFGHALNTAAWLTLMRGQSYDNFGRFRGFVLTGWQRYDHFSVLCELLPASVPSLAITLLVAMNGRLEDGVLGSASAHLGCPENGGFSTESASIQALLEDRTLVRHLYQCAFPGSSAYRLMWNLQTLKGQVSRHLRKMTQEDGWLTLYNVRRNFSNPYRVREAAQKTNTFLRSTMALKKHAETVLQGFFEQNSRTVNEWVEQQIEPMVTALRLVDAKVQPIVARNTWPRRPLS